LSRRKFVLLAAVLGAVALAPAAASAKDYAIIARDIVPSGQYGSVPPPPQATQQAQMYNALTPLFDHVTPSDLLADFKPEPLGTAGSGPLSTETVPHAGVTIIRDRYDVPHITGKTRDAVTWGAGWVIAEDRGLLLQEARYDSLVAAIDAPGLSAIDLIGKLETFKPSAQTEREVAKQTGVLRAAGAKGRAVLHDLDLYLQGINSYFKAHGSTAAPFTLNDIYTFNALKDQFVFHRAQPGLGLVADLSRARSDRHLRRDAVRP
jgi:acyl-homoserine lactone acylase PvdQ